MPARQDSLKLRIAIRGSSLGLVLIARGAAGVSAVLLGDDRDELLRDVRARFPGASFREEHGEEPLIDDVMRVVESPEPVDVPVDLRGSEFQRLVWNALRHIPAGATATYAEIAARIGRPRSVRAVARACAANHLAVIVPCHRVVRSDGGLSGYRWGIERKRTLLAREGITAGESIPAPLLSST
jgi:AraC family transcriptional regulator of adaptative response/methylated-DNA-[protein]-cysteine methyltransferase